MDNECKCSNGFRWILKRVGITDENLFNFVFSKKKKKKKNQYLVIKEKWKYRNIKKQIEIEQNWCYGIGSWQALRAL